MVGDQRRIATVLFADLVGFTALSEKLDPEQVKALVDRCFERLAADIDAFGGRVDKVMGDAIVALFGAPVAHEDDAERAVRAGLRMQQTIGVVGAEVDHAVRMRVGINTGEVLVGAVRAGREYTAMGDVVNTASRLQAAAEPGTVLVGPDTYAATRDVVSYDSIDPVIAKGKALPVEAWVAVRATVPPGHRPRRRKTPLIGRESELALLTNVTTTSIERSRAALLVVHGEAGMGKSRLAEETAGHAVRELGALVLEGRCVPYGEANVWWPIADAIRSASGLSPDASMDEMDAGLRRAATASLEQSGRLAELDRVVAGLHHLLGNDSLRGIDVARAREEAIRSVVAVAEGYTHLKPLVVVLSDLHWADQEVLDLVDTLLVRLARRPFVLVATARRSLRERWSPSAEAANQVVLHLDPLDAEAARRLLVSLTDGELHPSLASMLVDRSGGNPFYLEELVALIAEAGVSTADQLLATEAGELPSTLRGLVAARLDALGPVDRNLLDDAAVLGRRNKIGALVTMAHVKRGVDAEAARAHIENLAAREFLILEGDNYTFRSEVIREVAYSTLTKADRARSHAGIAQWMEQHEDREQEHVVDQIANHYAAAAELSAEIGAVAGVPDDVRVRAVDALVEASRRADADSIPAVAASLATRALGLLGERDQMRAEVLRIRATAFAEQYELDLAEADATESLELARSWGDERDVGEAQLVLGEIHLNRSEFATALAVLDDARQRFEGLGADDGVAQVWRKVGMLHLRSGDYARADEALQAALVRFQALDDPRSVAWTEQNLSWSAYVSGRIDEAERRVLASMSTFEELGDPGGLTWSRGLLAWVRFHQGRDAEADALAQEVGADAHERGEVFGEGMMAMLTGSIALWSGRADDAVPALERASDLFAEIDDHVTGVQARCGLGRALIMAGEIDRGLGELEQARAENEEFGFGLDQARVTILSASVQLGDVDLGRAAIAGLSGDAAAGQVGGADRAVSLAIHAVQAGDAAAATARLATVSDERGYVDAGRALLAAVTSDEAGVLDAAERISEHSNTYLDCAFVDIARALDLARRGDVAEARAVLAGTIELVDATQDRLAQAVIRLVDAMVAEVHQRPDADAVRAVADQRLLALGIRADGWRNVVAGALDAVTTA